MRLSNYVLMEKYRLKRSRTIWLILLTELIVMILCYLQTDEGFFSLKRLPFSTYYNLQITVRYMVTTLIVNEVFMIDLEVGLFKTAISMGYNRYKLLLIKLVKCILIVTIPQIIASSTYGIVGTFLNNDVEFFYRVIIDIFINILPLISYILLLIFIGIITKSTSLMVMCSFVLVFFTQLLPYDIAKYLLPTYNNLRLAWEYSNAETRVLIVGVLSVSTLFFSVANGIYFSKMDV